MRTAPDVRTATRRTSSCSGGDGAECVEVSPGLPGLAPVRDSRNPAVVSSCSGPPPGPASWGP
ncbi:MULTISPECIES: DUF397 domain-containing protein [Streptomyces]|uniref:DUF397 domain-containing protein n=1 Tax=Streptomyces TaxID=1883 RepID=UPI0029C05514|nr:DUF397 domain-containing protein [Streptomyces sp. ND04-05B]